MAGHDTPDSADTLDPVDPVEIEVKLGVEEPDVIRALLTAPPPDGIAGFVPAGPPRPTIATDRYLDTADPAGRLDAAGLRARLREEDGKVVLALKTEGQRDGDVHHRLELEGPATRSLDPASWPPSTARTRLLAASAGEPLRVIAALRQRRLKRRFRYSDTEIEISLDEMEALDGTLVVARRAELEAELVVGDPAALHGLATTLRGIAGVVDPSGSKLRFAQEALAAHRAAQGC